MIANRDTFADIAGMSPSTLLRRLAEGMPGEKMPDGSWRIETAAAIAWLEERARAKSSPDDGRTRAEARIADAKAGLVELKLTETQRTWLHCDDVPMLISEQLNAIRQTFDLLPDQIADSLAHEPDPARCRTVIRQAVHQAYADSGASAST